MDDEAQERLNEEDAIQNKGRHVQKVEIELVDTSNTQTRGAADDQHTGDAENEGAEDLINYKGIYFNDNNEKQMDEATGAHFQYEDIFQRLIIAKVERNRTDMELKISYSSQNEDERLSPISLQKHDKKYK